MIPMTIPDKRYWEKRWRSMRLARGPAGPPPSVLSVLVQHQVAGLQFGREDDLRLREGHVGLRVLHEQHGRCPLLPVGAVAAREGDGAVPARELVGEKRLHD